MIDDTAALSGKHMFFPIAKKKFKQNVIIEPVRLSPGTSFGACCVLVRRYKIRTNRKKIAKKQKKYAHCPTG